jgi:hypothetical protein
VSGLTFYGLSTLVGRTVAAWVCGLDCGTYVVQADGSITVPYQSDPDGLFTAAYAINVSNHPPVTPSTAIETTILGWGAMAVQVNIASTLYTIPVALGATYTSQGQLVRPDEPAQGQNGPGPGKTRRNHMIAAKLVNAVSGGVSFGTDFTGTLLAASLPGNGLTNNAKNAMFSGVYWSVVEDGYSFDGQVTWQITRPYPCTVTSLSGFIEMQDR